MQQPDVLHQVRAVGRYPSLCCDLSLKGPAAGSGSVSRASARTIPVVVANRAGSLWCSRFRVGRTFSAILRSCLLRSRLPRSPAGDGRGSCIPASLNAEGDVNIALSSMLDCSYLTSPVPASIFPIFDGFCFSPGWTGTPTPRPSSPWAHTVLYLIYHRGGVEDLTRHSVERPGRPGRQPVAVGGAGHSPEPSLDRPGRRR